MINKLSNFLDNRKRFYLALEGSQGPWFTGHIRDDKTEEWGGWGSDKVQVRLYVDPLISNHGLLPSALSRFCDEMESCALLASRKAIATGEVVQPCVVINAFPSPDQIGVNVSWTLLT